MGALRAAELDTFGMTGVGAIYEAFRDGQLEDDDEVAVIHAGAEHGFRQGSDAMVNIRATLRLAEAHVVIDSAAARILESIAKRLFYAERCYPRLLDLAADSGVPTHALGAFRDWIRQGHAVDQKRDDAIALLHAIAAHVLTPRQAAAPLFHFEESVYWEDFRRLSAGITGHLVRADSVVLERLRADEAAWKRACSGALGWYLALESIRAQGKDISSATLLDFSQEFCESQGVKDSADLDAWLESNACGRSRLDRILRTRALAEGVRIAGGAGFEAVLCDYVRWTGEFKTLIHDRDFGALVE